MDKKKTAFIGLGVMGFPMAGHLKNKGGHDVTVYNRNAAKADKWVAQYGGKKAATPKEATLPSLLTSMPLPSFSNRLTATQAKSR